MTSADRVWNDDNVEDDVDARMPATPAGDPEAVLAEPLDFDPANSNEPKTAVTAPRAIVLRRLVRRIGITIMVTLAFALCAWAAARIAEEAYYKTYGLPEYDVLEEAMSNPLLHATRRADGSFSVRCSCALPVDNVPDHVRDAFVAIEDARFSVHSGVDWIGMARALTINVIRLRIDQGGSTITQQLAKTLVGSDRSFERKIREALLARRLERRYSKDEILDLYLNRVYFGRNIWGIEAAALTYFHKHASELNLFEGAVLAGMMKAPNTLDPGRYPNRAARRAELVLAAMVEQFLVSPGDAARTGHFGAKPGRRSAPRFDARYFEAWVAREAKAIATKDQIPGRTFSIVATIDPRMQIQAERAAERSRQEATAHNARQIAIVAMDTSGRVRALVGGRDFAKSQYDRVTQAKRQPGSTYKMFTYLAALEGGRTPDSMIRDLPVNVQGWQPRNHDGRFQGRLPMREAFARSRNAATVRLAVAVHFDKVAEMARRFGVPASTNPASVLGSLETSPLVMTAAYAAIANGGHKVTPTGLLAMLDNQGRVVHDATERNGARIVDEKVAASMKLMLKASARHTFPRLRRDREIAGKTGTTQNFRDAWFVGFDDRIVAGVWFGNDDGKPMRGVAGGTLPAKTWLETVSPSGR